MNIGKISPVFSGNYKVSKANSKVSSNNSVSNNEFMDKNTVTALKAQISFGNGLDNAENSKGIKVINESSILATLNGQDRIKDNMFFSTGVYEIKSTSKGDKRNIVITKNDEPIVEGFISKKLDKNTKIEFKAAKHKPEIKLTLDDGTTIQLLEGSKIADKKGNFELRYPGKYSVYENGEKTARQVLSATASNISFKGNYTSLLCKKDATVKATNNAKDIPFITSGVHYETVKNDDPTFAVLAGGFGTRFANMAVGEENKPSFVMPNGHSILSSAYDLVKNATAASGLGNITYLEQNAKETPAVSEGLVSPEDTVIPMRAFESDGGAIINAVLEGKIPTDKPLIVLNADTITNVDVSQAYEKLKTLRNAAIVIPKFPVSETRAKSFGLMKAGSMVDKQGSMELLEFIEKPKNPSKDAVGAMIQDKKVDGEQAYYGNPGIYIFNKEVLQNIKTILPVAEEIALKKAQDAARKEGKEIPTELKDPFSSSTFLGNAFVPAVVKLCNEGVLKTAEGNKMKTYMVPMLTTTEKEAYWDDIGAAEAFVHVCQDIAFETKSTGTGSSNKFFGIRGIEEFANSVDISKGIVYASPNDRENFEARHAHKFEIAGDTYITCK